MCQGKQKLRLQIFAQQHFFKHFLNTWNIFTWEFVAEQQLSP